MLQSLVLLLVDYQCDFFSLPKANCAEFTTVLQALRSWLVQHRDGCTVAQSLNRQLKVILLGKAVVIPGISSHNVLTVWVFVSYKDQCLAVWFLSGTLNPWSTLPVSVTLLPFWMTFMGKSLMKPIRSASPQSLSL